MYVVLIFLMLLSTNPSSIQIKLRNANGEATERWILTSASGDSAQDENDYDERWELLQRIGRFLGRF